MKKITITLMTLILISSLKAQTTLYTESFETDLFSVNYVMNRFTDGGQDYFGVTDAQGNTLFVGVNSLNPFAFPMTNLNGTNCVAAEDLKRTDNPLNSVTDGYRGYFITKTVDVSTYANVQVKLLIGCRDVGSFGTHEAADNDAFRIQYAFDTDIANGANNTSPGLTNESTVNTGNYTDIGRFLPNNQFGTGTGAMQEDTNLDGSPDGALLGNTLVEYEYTIPVTGTNLSIRIHMDYDDSAEEMAFDYLRIIGNGTLNINDVNFNNNLKFYPNPMNDTSTIIFDKMYNNIKIETYNVLGQKINSKTYNSTDRISNFKIARNEGVYFIHVNADDKKSVLKVVKRQ